MEMRRCRNANRAPPVHINHIVCKVCAQDNVYMNNVMHKCVYDCSRKCTQKGTHLCNGYIKQEHAHIHKHAHARVCTWLKKLAKPSCPAAKGPHGSNSFVGCPFCKSATIYTVLKRRWWWCWGVALKSRASALAVGGERERERGRAGPYSHMTTPEKNVDFKLWTNDITILMEVALLFSQKNLSH